MFKKILASIVLGITAFAQVADAAVIYSQASAAWTTSINSQEAIGGSDYDVIAFATFTPTQSGTIDNISWQGTSNNSFAYAGFSDGFSIDVLDGQFALPGTTQYAPVSHTNLATTSLANPTVAANGMYDYNTDIKPFNVKAWVTYRISIRSNGIAPWGWASVPGTGTIAYYKGLASVRNVSGIPVFSLNNVHNSSVAPAPTNPTTVTILPVPAPTPTTVAGEIGQVQGMITAVGNKYVNIDNAVVTHDGDTVKTFHGGLKVLAVGEMVNYTYIVDVDGVIIATTMDIYPAETITGTERVNRIDVNNATSVVALTLYRGPVVDFYQASGIYVSGAGTNTSYGSQLVNYTGFINPTTSHIVASVNGYMSNIPVTFYPVLPAATVGKAYRQYAIDISAYGAANIYSLSATGLPPGMTNNMGVISGTPTTPGTYTVNLIAIGGQYNVAPYTQVGNGNVTIVVYPDATVTPVPDTTAPVITLNGGDVTLTEGDVYADAGATCTDNIDATCTVVTTNTVSTATAGTYTVDYSATDAAGNTSTATRTVTVNPAPVVIVPCSGVDQVITNAANARGGIVEIGGGPSNGGIAVQIFQASTTIVAPLTASTFFKAGNLISYVGTMNANNLCVTTSATVSAPADTTAPVITLNGGDVTLTVGDAYTDAGATATDAVDGTVTVTSNNNVDTTTAGTYTVNYSATDAAGNTSTATRTVTVNPAPDITAPVITINGGNVTLTAGSTYTDAGATAVDAVDGVVAVTTSSNINTTVAGTYTVIYTAKDAAGNTSTATRTVSIKAPVIVPPTTSTGNVSTGVKVEGTNKIITAVNTTTINIGSLIIRITPTTTIKLNNNKPLKVGDRIEYKGTKNTDGSITATSVKIQ